MKICKIENFWNCFVRTVASHFYGSPRLPLRYRRAPPSESSAPPVTQIQNYLRVFVIECG